MRQRAEAAGSDVGALQHLVLAADEILVEFEHHVAEALGNFAEVAGDFGLRLDQFGGGFEALFGDVGEIGLVLEIGALDFLDGHRGAETAGDNG